MEWCEVESSFQGATTGLQKLLEKDNLAARAGMVSTTNILPTSRPKRSPMLQQHGQASGYRAFEFLR
jgi:hypothetical protein